jgi:hypothetical protein
MSNERKLSTNVKRLMARFAAREAIPRGGGMADAIQSIITPGRMAELSRNALAKVDLAIAAMRAAPDNPYGDDEETIAGAILAEIEKKELENMRDRKRGK